MSDLVGERRPDREGPDLMSLVTHELRLPLTSIKGYTDLVHRGIAGPLTDQQKQFLGIVLRNVARMSTLIDSLADINRIQTERLKLTVEPLAPSVFIAAAAAELEDAIAGRGQTLRLAVPADLPPASGDRQRVIQVLTILLSNANLYTPEGGAIAVEAEAGPASPGYLRITVRDNGVGIAADDQRQLFTFFFRSANEAVRAQSGWGLGLYIAHELVTRLGGTITCESEYGQGSAFRFTLPLAPAS